MSTDNIIKKLKQAEGILLEALQDNDSPMVEKAVVDALLALYWARYNMGECETLDVYEEIMKGGKGGDSTVQSPA